jgi:formylglycine-generating enzyme required for sulfatase activity
MSEPAVDPDSNGQSRKREGEVNRRARRTHIVVSVLVLGVVAVVVGWFALGYVKKQIEWYATTRPYKLANVDPYVLSPEAERALKPLASFRECAKDCPEMIVIPAGSYLRGSPENEKGRYRNESPQSLVTIAKPFAVSKFAVTFAEWDACVAVGGCPQVGDSGFGRGSRPVINVSWDEARQYAEWLSWMTDRSYRLLTEAEWEYAARAGTTTAYFWGDEIGKGHADCRDCGSRWDGKETAPVGSFAPNAFGLYDMAGNAWQWVQDCYHVDYVGAPIDGSAWTSGTCRRRVVRGGSWNDRSQNLRSAFRGRGAPGERVNAIGFRLARTLAP